MMHRLPSRVAVKAFECAMMRERAAAHAYTAGDDYRAYKLWQAARDAYRRLGFDRNADRCDVRAQKAWADASGENVGE